jgi:Fur family ferric uptake transcriptional regulator
MKTACEERLLHRGVKPTAIRLLVLREMLSLDHAFSLAELEARLDTVDKSTLSRVLNLFRQQRLIHSIDDGSGSAKYALCSHDCQCILDQQHVHFHCTECDETSCLEDISAPVIALPDNYQVDSVNYVLKGVCVKCARKGRQST